jgi:D-alanyl-D-alanine carboxypeptidase
VTLILQLANEGKLSLDDTIDKYVGGVTDGSSITLRELAGMSSGVAEYVGELINDFQADPNRLFTLDELNGFALGRPANFAPGTRRVYTNSNTNLLGAVIEKVTGQSVRDVLNERILNLWGSRTRTTSSMRRSGRNRTLSANEPVDGVLRLRPPTCRSMDRPAR